MVNLHWVCMQNGSAPLHLASENGLVQTVELLLEHGANADLENHVCSVGVHVHSLMGDTQ
jgi:ankyrin repeat protein